MQYCYSNFPSIEDVEKCSNRGGFRQKFEAMEEMLWFLHPRKRHIWPDLEGQLKTQIRQIKSQK
jgi:hypothetical protein